MTKEITLALGGGGSKGNAHIGVLRALDRMGYKVKAIAGTSAGGLVGCLYASGFKPDEIEVIPANGFGWLPETGNFVATEAARSS